VKVSFKELSCGNYVKLCCSSVVRPRSTALSKSMVGFLVQSHLNSNAKKYTVAYGGYGSVHFMSLFTMMAVLHM